MTNDFISRAVAEFEEGELHQILMPAELVPDLEAQITNQIKDLVFTELEAAEKRGREEAISKLKEGTWPDENGFYHFVEAHLEAARSRTTP